MLKTLSEVAAELGQSYDRVWITLQKRKVPFPKLKVGKKTFLFDEREVAELRRYFAERDCMKEIQAALREGL